MPSERLAPENKEMEYMIKVRWDIGNRMSRKSGTDNDRIVTESKFKLKKGHLFEFVLLSNITRVSLPHISLRSSS